MKTSIIRTCLSASLGLLALAAIPRPAAAQVAIYHGCSGFSPTAYEVWIYANSNYGGQCRALYQGFYPHPANFGLPNDSISSIRVGANVRARVFGDENFGASFMTVTGDVSLLTGGWNDGTSSIRVESRARSTTCNDLTYAEFALFRDANLGSDCVVLNANNPGTFSTPEDMGMCNDCVTSVLVGPRDPYWPANVTHYITLYQNAAESGPFTNILWSTTTSTTAAVNIHVAPYSFNDRTSSISMTAFF